MADIASLVIRKAEAEARLLVKIQTVVQRMLGDFGGWYSPAQVEEFAAAIAQIVGSGQRQVALLTDAYLAKVLSSMLGNTAPPVGVAVSMSQTQRHGVTATEVYARLAAEYRRQAAFGVADPLALVANRANEMVGTDLTLARQVQSWRSVASRSRVTGYRRVTAGEVSSKSGGVCSLCAIASSKIYHRGDLMPVHSRCRCEVVPIVGADDPGDQINAAQHYDDHALRPAVIDHPELGPQLRVEGQNVKLLT